MGSFLVDRLECEGHRVSVLSRAPESVKAPADRIVADVSKAGWLAAIDPSQFDYVVHMAYATTGNAEYDRAVTVKSVVDVIEHFRNSALKHFILLGSMSVFGMKLQDCKIDEDAPRVPDCEYAKNKIDAASAAMGANTGFAVTVLHPTGVYKLGSKRLTMYENIFKVGYFLDQEKCLGINNIVHADDVANAILLSACRKSGGLAEEYICNGEAILYLNWLSALESRLGVADFQRLPSFLAPLCRGPIRRLLVLGRFRIPIRLPAYKMEIFQRKALFSSEKALAHFGWSASKRFSDADPGAKDNLCDY